MTLRFGTLGHAGLHVEMLGGQYEPCKDDTVINCNDQSGDSDGNLSCVQSQNSSDQIQNTIHHHSQHPPLAFNDFLGRDLQKVAPWLGIHVGCTRIEAAHTHGWSNFLPFALESRLNQLAAHIAGLLASAPAFTGVAVTLTGEAASCFATRTLGVAHILEQLTSIIPASMVRVYGMDGSWHVVGAAARDPWNVGSSSWHALGALIGLVQANDNNLIVNVGSSRTDIIPTKNGSVGLEAKTDSQRLQSGVLVYTGAEQSNVASISRCLPLFGESCPVINELYATTRDVHIWLGDMPEDSQCLETADGRPATKDGARYRLARLVGEDGSTLADSDIQAIAERIRADQVRLIASGMKQVCSVAFASKKASQKARAKAEPDKTAKLGAGTKSGGGASSSEPLPRRIFVSGHASFLVEDAVQYLQWDTELVQFSDLMGHDISRTVQAYSVAVLASQQIANG